MWRLWALAALLAAGMAGSAAARPATVITDCTQAGVQAALDGGGSVTFDCGPGPVTIPLTTPLILRGSVTLDGGGSVTFDGQEQTKLFESAYSAVPRTLALQNLRLINGRAPMSGGRAAEAGAALTAGDPGTRVHISNVTFENNATTHTSDEDNQGGAIFVHNAYELLVRDSVFRNNRAGSGGAIGIIAAGLLIERSVFENNQAVDASAGGIVRGYGGALHLDGVWNDYNPNTRNRVQVFASRFVGNSAVRGGGALAMVVSDNAGTVIEIADTTFHSNVVSGLDGAYGQGGGLYLVEDDHAGGRTEESLIIRASTFSANQAGRQGGGAWISILGRGVIANTTFVSNTTTAPLNEVGQGGGMAITLGNIAIVNSAFAYNHAAYQAGALHAGGASADREVTLTNTIFLHNTLNEQELPSPTRWQGYHTNRPLGDGGANIQHPQFKPTYNNDVNNNITAAPIYQDPLLGALGDHGGPTQTLPLQAASPARDAAVQAACPVRDQRAAIRLGPCDIGPYEHGGSLFVATERVLLPVVVR